MPQEIIRQIPLIQRYSRNNEAQDFRFRAFIKFQLDMSNAQLDAIVKETTDEVWSQMDCTTCANCCKTLQIVVDLVDVKRLAKRFEVTAAQFKQRYVITDDGKTMCFQSTPCVFLGADNRCTVYEDRPQACRDFPYLHEPDFRSRSFMMTDNTAVCPIVFNVWQLLKQRLRRRKGR